MTVFQKVIKYLAVALALFLTVSIISGIFSIVGLFGTNVVGETAIGDMKTYSIASEIYDLDIEVNAADLCIKTGESFVIESNLKHLKIEEKDGRLLITDLVKNNFFGINTYKNAVLTIYIPAEVSFDRVDFLTGAGRLTVDRISAQAVNFVLGAGEASIGTLIAEKSAEIEGGAGRITISGGSLRNLEMDMGVGELNLTSALCGDCSLDMGIGKSNITLIGSSEDYRLDIEKGIGSVTVDGKPATDSDAGADASNRVEINGGIGAINVIFEEAE